MHAGIAAARVAQTAWRRTAGLVAIGGWRPQGASMDRINISTGTRWEPIIGYSRAVRVGNIVHVSGTTATDAEGNVVGAGNPYKQAVQTLQNIAAALQRAGARPEHVVRTRIYLTRISDWEQIGRAHGEIFGNIRPACSMIEVSRLVSPEMLVEIEAEAIVGDQPKAKPTARPRAAGRLRSGARSGKRRR